MKEVALEIRCPACAEPLKARITVSGFLSKAFYLRLFRIPNHPDRLTEGASMIVGDCAQCGQSTEDDELMDFGPFKGQLVCDDCWQATDYRDLKMYGLHSCATCGAVIKDEDRGLHDDWHVAHTNHGHPYAACYGPGGEWDTTTGPVPAKQIT